MFEKSMFDDLLRIVSLGTKENLMLSKKDNGNDKFSILENYNNTDKDNFTQIEFRFESNALIISWLYLKTQSAGIGSKIFDWFIDFCHQNDIKVIKVNCVGQDKIEMQGLLKKYGFEKIEDGEFMNFAKML